MYLLICKVNYEYHFEMKNKIYRKIIVIVNYVYEHVIKQKMRKGKKE